MASNEKSRFNKEIIMIIIIIAIIIIIIIATIKIITETIYILTRNRNK